jgi:predicted metalloprotease
MRWKSGRRSTNAEDRRGVRLSRKATGGGLGMIVLALVALYFGVDPSFILNMGGGPGGQPETYTTSAPTSSADDALAEFVSVKKRPTGSP